ncbi:N-acetylmannosamine-6-phosphate 2-epimerase [bacterium]|nr:N-acetylmannosamine-6-phosphate 2-epimerase [bacterium]
MDIIKRLKNKVVVSVQAMPSEPLYLEKCMVAMMKSVVKGGAGALRVAGARDVKNAKHLFDIPVIGLTKPEVIPQNFREIVYITPEIKDVIGLINAGADVVAFDGTSRKRPGDCTLEEIIKHIKINKRVSMADISTLEEGLNCAELGADILSTTLSGYTTQSPMVSDEPDFELLENLVKQTDKPVILEGRIWEPEQVNRAFELGAHSVVIGSAITRPQLITKRFVQRKP